MTRAAQVSGKEIREALNRRFRSDHGRVIAALTRRFGVQRIALIENAVQDAYVRALEHWSHAGSPDQPERWLVAVAHNLMVDALRGEHVAEPLDAAAETAIEPPALERDDELRLMFFCCTPALARAAQIALVLNVFFGLSARQIASAFLTDERAVAQRIVRAKQHLREAGSPFDFPVAAELPLRLAAIQDVLYLLFTEGHNPTEDDDALSVGLCSEALRLVRLLTDSFSAAIPANFALRALMCFHAARFPARMANDGSLLLIAEQDRTLWDRELTAEAFMCLGQAGTGDQLTRFHVEAGIAACHAAAPSYAATDWARIVDLYDLLRQLAPSLVVDVNRALALAMRSGAQAGLDELDGIPEREVLRRYPYALAAYADLHASLGNLEDARSYLDRALENQNSPAQRALLTRKRSALER